MNVPKIRFSEFTDEWNYEPLNKYSERIVRKNKDNESNLVLTISAQYGLVDQCSFFNRNVSSTNLSGYYLLYNGDFAYNKSYSNGYPWGAVKRLNLYDKGVVSSLYICFRNNSIMDSDYLQHYFETDKWYSQISSISVEGARNHGLLNIAVNDFFNTEHFFPTLNEQKRISKFLNLLDKKIELQSKKIDDLKLFKLYTMNRLLSEKIKRKITISEIGEIITGTTPSKEKSQYWENGENVWVTPSDITEKRDIDNSNYKLTDEGLKKGKFVPKNSILVTCIASIGKNAVLKKDGSCNQQINAIKPNDGFNSNYVYYLISSISKYMQSIAGTSATSIINKEQFGNIIVSVHDKEYQNKIDKLLSSFERKIELELQKLYKIEQMKKGFMQSMFV